MTMHSTAPPARPPVWTRQLDQIEYVPFDDPHLPSGPDSAHLKIAAPNVFWAKFPPGYTAPTHSHPYDTVYYVQFGRIRFGDEGWVGPGGLRGVTAGHEYGPEEADPELGAEFLLVSAGPIDITWSTSVCTAAARVQAADAGQDDEPVDEHCV